MSTEPEINSKVDISESAKVNKLQVAYLAWESGELKNEEFVKLIESYAHVVPDVSLEKFVEAIHN